MTNLSRAYRIVYIAIYFSAEKDVLQAYILH